ncbi:hypothetical protein JKP88DRAFT_247106 [Tribonema minus]|uniref:Uncharacterized protein n=1 Tax=Tribonema minus TaxID=303371 RepID=A0A835YRV9_9STRA|nr:hypothetical protein JKP88DRAFT_247106 [Tribonema minus]
MAMTVRYLIQQLPQVSAVSFKFAVEQRMKVGHDHTLRLVVDATYMLSSAMSVANDYGGGSAYHEAESLMALLHDDDDLIGEVMGAGAETPAAPALPPAINTATPQPVSDAVISSTLTAAVNAALQAVRADISAAGTEGARAAVSDSQLEPLAPAMSVVLSLATLTVQQIARQQAEQDDMRGQVAGLCGQVAGLQATLQEVLAKLPGLANKPPAGGRTKAAAKDAHAAQELHALANLVDGSKCALTDWYIFGSPILLSLAGPDDMAMGFINWLHGPVAAYLVNNSEAKNLLGMPSSCQINHGRCLTCQLADPSCLWDKRGASYTREAKEVDSIKEEDAPRSDTGLTVRLGSCEARLALASAFFRQELEEARAFSPAISTAMPYTLEMATVTRELERLSSAHIGAHGAARSKRQQELGELIMRLSLPDKCKAKPLILAAPHTRALVFLAWHMTLLGQSAIERVALLPHVKLVASLIRATAGKEFGSKVPKELDEVLVDSDSETESDDSDDDR